MSKKVDFNRFKCYRSDLDLWLDTSGEMSNMEATNYVRKYRPDYRPKYIKVLIEKLNNIGVNTKDSRDVKERFSIGTDSFIYAFNQKKYHYSCKAVDIYIQDKDSIRINNTYAFKESDIAKALASVPYTLYMDERKRIYFPINKLDDCVMFIKILLRNNK
jgi:hypothetical protein